MAELYRLFAQDWAHVLDLSDEALVSLFNHESRGLPLSAGNGFAVGKQYLNLQVTMWREDLAEGTIFKWELYEDERFPRWWLDSVLDNRTPHEDILAPRTRLEAARAAAGPAESGDDR